MFCFSFCERFLLPTTAALLNLLTGIPNAPVCSRSPKCGRTGKVIGVILGRNLFLGVWFTHPVLALHECQRILGWILSFMSFVIFCLFVVDYFFTFFVSSFFFVFLYFCLFFSCLFFTFPLFFVVSLFLHFLFISLFFKYYMFLCFLHFLFIFFVYFLHFLIPFSLFLHFLSISCCCFFIFYIF